MSREYTPEEVRTMLLKHAKGLVKYWATTELNDGQPDTVEYRIEGAMFSLFATLDGCSGALPAFIVAPFPHSTDKQYHADNNENWFPENSETDVNCDVGGSLHHHFHRA